MLLRDICSILLKQETQSTWKKQNKIWIKTIHHYSLPQICRFDSSGPAQTDASK